MPPNNPKQGETAMKINPIPLNRLRNDANFQFHSEFKELAEKQTPEALKIEHQFEAYLPLYDKVDLALKKIAKSSITEQIQEADKARDNIWKGLVETNTTALRHFSNEVREAAKRLKIVFDTYGNIAIKSLSEQTSATYNILQDLESGKYASDVAKVGLGEWVAELKARNIALAELMRERVDEGSMKVDIVLKKARTQLDEAYYSIVERVNAFVVIEGSASYESFIKKMNINISKFSLLMPVRKKQGKRGGGKNSTNGGSHEQG
jgi:hypothetical protein